MKRSILLIGMLLIAVLLFECFIVVGDSSAFGCGHQSFYCFNRKTGEYMGEDFVRFCWSWSYFECVPCYCDGDNDYCTSGYFAKWCNIDYPRCKGQCCQCYQKHGACSAPNCEYCYIPHRK